MLQCVKTHQTLPLMTLRQTLTASAVAFVLLPFSAAAFVWRNGLHAADTAFSVDPFEVDLQLYDRNDGE